MCSKSERIKLEHELELMKKIHEKGTSLKRKSIYFKNGKDARSTSKVGN